MKRFILLILVSVLFQSTAFAEEPDHSLKKINVQLQWKYQFQFAGFMMAKELGYYKDAGLDVHLLEYQGGDISKSIQNKKVEYFLQNAALLVDSNGSLQNVVLLASYFQRSPLILITQPGIQHISDLKGKRIMQGGNTVSGTALEHLLQHYNITPLTAKFVPHSFNLDDFIQKRVDAMSVFRTDQVYELKKAGALFNVIDPAEYGYVTNANNLFTSKEYAQTHKKEINAFLQATKKGWEYALAHIKETSQIIYDKYSKRKSMDALVYEGEMTKELMLPEIYKTGEINEMNLAFLYKQYVRTLGKKADMAQLQSYIYNTETQRTAFTQQEAAYLHKKKKIIFCVDPKWHPYEWIDENGQYRGLGADYFRLFTKKLPLQTQLLVTKNWSETIAAIKEGRCDLIPMIGVTPERKTFLNFTTPYYFAPYVVATTLDKSFIENFSNKRDKKYAVIGHSAVIDDLKRRYKKINIVEVPTIAEGIKMLQNGEVFGFINTAKVISFYIQEHDIQNIKIDAKLPMGYNLAMATAKEEKQLRNILQSLINSADPQEIEKIKSRWSGVVLESRKDNTLLYKILAFVSLLLLALLYRAYLLRKANKELSIRVEEKTEALQKLNNHLEEKIEQRTKELKHQAYFDALTNLPNRTLFHDRLQIALEKSKRHKQRLALFFIDLDRFKEINDSLGHYIGDEVLKIVANRLHETIRKEDTLARIGGDEFTLLVENVGNVEECIAIAQKMLDTTKAPIEIQKHTLYVSLSMGIAIAPQDATTAVDLLKNADAAMYKAKEQGRNTFEFYSPQMSTQAYEKLMMQNKLKEAIKNDEFEVYYQPQIDSKNKKTIGFEALVRWIQKENNKVVSPAEFMDVARETGMIVDIDKIVLQKAIRQFALWNKQGLCEGRISINLDAKELQGKGYVDFLASELQKNTIAAQHVEIEITESDIMQNPQDAVKKLEKIHALGVRIAIDDFGTGYSSLAYLKRFPIDKLKIDQSFVRDIPYDDDDCAIVKAVIALGKNLGLSLIAEGVETKQQELFLQEHDCYMIQGYLYAKPMPADAAEEFLKTFNNV